MDKLKSWKIVALILGVIFAFLGIITMIFPGWFLTFLPKALGIILFVTGILAIVEGVRNHKVATHTANMEILRGIVYMLVALIFLFKPVFTLEFLTVFIGVWALFDGCTKIALTFSLSQANQPWGLLLLDGIIQVLFGMLILFNPFGGAVALAIIAGIYLLYFGLSMIAFGIWFKRNDDSF